MIWNCSDINTNINSKHQSTYQGNKYDLTHQTKPRKLVNIIRSLPVFTSAAAKIDHVWIPLYWFEPNSNLPLYSGRTQTAEEPRGAGANSSKHVS